MLPENFGSPMRTEPPRRPAAQNAVRPSASGALNSTRSATLASETYSKVPVTLRPSPSSATDMDSCGPRARSLPPFATMSPRSVTWFMSSRRLNPAMLTAGSGAQRNAHRG